ncbi:MAG: hypothetical protein ACRC13_06865 [Tannerellaceae bacterium]
MNERYFDKLPLYLIFPFSLIVDILNGVLQQVFGVETILPSVFKIFIIVYLSRYMYKINSYLIYIPVIVIIYFICSYLYWSASDMGVNLVYSISFFVRLIYWYFILIYLWYYRDQLNILVLGDYVFYYCYFAAISIIISWITGLGIGTYGDNKLGTKGYFVAGNDIALCLLMSLCLAFALYQHTKSNKYIFFALVIAMSSVLISSFTGIAGAFLLVSFFILSLFVKFTDYHANYNIKISVVIIMLIILFPIIQFVTSMVTSNEYMLYKFSSLASLLFENQARKSLTDAAEVVLNNYSFFDYFFGQGDYFFRQISLYANTNNLFRVVEQDHYDIIGFFGFISGVVIIIFPLYITWKAFYNLIKNRTILNYWMCIASIIFVAHAFYAGHAFTSVQSSTIFAPIAFYVLNYKLTELNNENS